MLQRALRRYAPSEISNSDQGVLYTSPAFLQPFKDVWVKITMDGRRRALENVIIERFWRTIKYDEVYLNDHESLAEGRQRIGEYTEVYNAHRPQASLEGRTPNMAYDGRGAQTAA